MKKPFIRIESQTCPHCNTRQTVFINKFPKSIGVVEPDIIELEGYQCAVSSCQKRVIGQDYYIASGATVGDFKTT